MVVLGAKLNGSLLGKTQKKISQGKTIMELAIRADPAGGQSGKDEGSTSIRSIAKVDELMTVFTAPTPAMLAVCPGDGVAEGVILVGAKDRVRVRQAAEFRGEIDVGQAKICGQGRDTGNP